MPKTSDPPTEAQVELGRRIGKWLSILVFWLALAPTIYLAGNRIVTVPILLGLEAFGVEQDTLETLRWVVGLAGFGVGAGLVWMVWKQAKGYFADHAA